MRFWKQLGAASLLGAAMVSTAPGQTTVMFQEGTGGYSGTFDVFIGIDTNDIPGGADGNVLGSSVDNDFVDGRYYDATLDGQEIQAGIRFDNIIGNGAGLVPAGSKIKSATLTLTTSTVGNAQSGGPYGVAQSLVDLGITSTWNSVGGDGITFPAGEMKRPHDHGFTGMDPGGTVVDADVTRIVQAWADGENNQGFIIRAGTTNGWAFHTSGAIDPATAPKLTIEYDAPASVMTETFQFGVGGYTDTTMAWLQDDDTTVDGVALDQEFLDGGTPNDQALVKFDKLFISEGGPVPDNANIVDAQLVVNTGSASRSSNSGTNGDFGAHQMLVDWTTTTAFSSFNGDGPTEADSEIGPVLDTTGAVVADAAVYFDITDAVSAWAGGAPNYGINIQSEGTTDGWAINWLGSVAPPQLIIDYTLAQCSPGDTDGDGDIDTGDITTSVINFTGAGGSTNKTCEDGDTDDDGDVDTGDLTFSIQNFTGAQAGNAGVPDLVYDPATGNVTIDADGADVISFSLQSGPFDAADFSELPAGLTDNIATQIGWTSFNLFSGLTGTANLGAILPAGLDQAGLEAALQTASYGLALAGGGGGGRLDLIIPEPASMVLMGLGAVALVRRRRAA